MSGVRGSYRHGAWALALLGLTLAACSGAGGGVKGPHRVKDRHPSVWTSNSPRVAELRNHYLHNNTVQQTAHKGHPYLPTIISIFDKHSLPHELAYLPMLESGFDNHADSGIARGIWQFTKTTAKAMQMRVFPPPDERQDWHKASEAAAKYLDQLGEHFGYNWGLALAAYNGGPHYVDQERHRQGSDDVFALRLHGESKDYVPRFVSMVQVLKQKRLYADLDETAPPTAAELDEGAPSTAAELDEGTPPTAADLDEGAAPTDGQGLHPQLTAEH